MRPLWIVIALFTCLSAHAQDARDPGSAADALGADHQQLAGAERVRSALHLGNLAARRKRPAEAHTYYQEARELAGPGQALALHASLNLATLASAPERPALLAALSRQLQAHQNASAALHLNLGHQAAQLKPPDLRLAYTHIEHARRLAQAEDQIRLRLEADDALASLYESQGRREEALALTLAALAQARQPAAVALADLLVALEWRLARLSEALGEPARALAAYERATTRLHAIRDELPIESDSGVSTLRETIAPLYLGYAASLLKRAEGEDPAARAISLTRVIEAVEQIKQAEMQDYLGDRCSVEAVQGGGERTLQPGTALLYPIMFADRVELLLQTSSGILRRTVHVQPAQVEGAANHLALALRNGMNDYMAPSRQLYDWLLRPFEQEWRGQSISTLVMVPDGALRMLPVAALHDGQGFAIEKFAIATVAGMSMTNTAAPRRQGMDALVVGVSEPGPVLEKLSQKMASAILQPLAPRARGGIAQTRTLRSLASADSEQLRGSLQLPGVKQELAALASVLPGMQLLNAQFTVAGFRRASGADAYRIVHIASHGVFGGSAESSFIMAYDDLLTMNGLQAILKNDKFLRDPVELLSLSACETAEGNERAPLGMSGAAIKARAKSVLGTLWPLEDNAAQQAMTAFYRGVAGGTMGKAAALRQAQLQLLKDPQAAHPFFWAPFVLIGNWL